MKVVTLNSIVAVIRARRGYKTFLAEFIQQCEIVDAISIPEGATNGDMVEKIFGKDVYCTLIRMMYSPCCKKLKEWWNAPFKKEVEE